MDAYAKATELWLLLHNAEQLAVNDPAYQKLMPLLNTCINHVGDIQRKLESRPEEMYTSRRVPDANGYVEFIYRLAPDQPLGRELEPIAAITDIYGSPTRPWFVAHYGIHEIAGPSVADVKQELFQLIDNGQ
jgi:hypothetical protein